MEPRHKIASKTVASLMFENEHTCCLCRDRNKDVEIHHIDGNNRNNKLSNLVVFCRDCHSKVTGAHGLGRSYSVIEVRKYKQDWESVVRKKRHYIIKTQAKLPNVEIDALDVEITNHVFEIAATSNVGRAKELLELLDVYCIYRVDSRFLLDRLYLIVPLVAGTRKVSLVGEHVTHYFGHLLGFDRRIARRDIQAMNKAIDVLSWLGENEAQLERNVTSLNACLSSLYEIFEIANAYGVRKVENKIVKAIKLIKTKASTPEGYFGEMRPVGTKADSYLKKIGRMKRRPNE